jgi:DNA mismatch repair protein MutL
VGGARSDGYAGAVVALEPRRPDEDGWTVAEVDEAAFRKFVNWQIEQGSHGVVPVGTTGESPTLDADEHKRVIEICIDEVKGRVPVIAGTGSNSTAEAIDYTIHAKEAGRQLLQVTDNGCGMSETDARMSFERHATSKIRSAKDLFSINTMGFRGEALASIAAVAQVELRTRRQSEELGTRIVIEDSTVKIQEPCQCPPGTNLSVKNLFYNVPARRNFLKADNIEMRHVLDEFQRVALAYPDLFFSLTHNDTEIFHLPAGNARQRVVKIFGDAINKRIVPVGEETEILKINGFVGKPDFFKKTAPSSYHLAALLSAKDEAAVALHKMEIIKNFSSAWEREGRANEKDSFISYIGFILSLLDQVKTPAANKKIKELQLSALKAIGKEVGK